MREIAATFADYWHAKAGQGALKLDWLATWHNWCRKARDERGVRLANGRGRESIHEARRRTAEAFGVAPHSRGDVYDLPPEDVHVIGPKH